MGDFMASNIANILDLLLIVGIIVTTVLFVTRQGKRAELLEARVEALEKKQSSDTNALRERQREDRQAADAKITALIQRLDRHETAQQEAIVGLRQLILEQFQRVSDNISRVYDKLDDKASKTDLDKVEKKVFEQRLPGEGIGR